MYLSAACSVAREPGKMRVSNDRFLPITENTTHSIVHNTVVEKSTKTAGLKQGHRRSSCLWMVQAPTISIRVAPLSVPTAICRVQPLTSKFAVD